MSAFHSIARRYARHRFGWLFLTLLVTLAGHAPLEALAPAVHPLEWLLNLNLAAAVLGLGRGRWARPLFALAAVFVAVRLAELLLGLPVLEPAARLLWTATSVLAVARTLGYAFQRGRVDSERIFAALDVYLLAGIVIGTVYWMIERTWPGSFASASGEPFSPHRGIYLSFVVMSTLGFGDFVPIGAGARGLVSVQAVGGQMYLAVLVARLVSLYSAQEHADRHGG